MTTASTEVIPVGDTVLTELIPVTEWPPVPERRPSEPEAVFVVGSSRSGTSLMRTILERSERIAVARENHFLGHLREAEGARYYFRREGDLHDDDTVRRIVDMIYSGEFEKRSRWRQLSPYWKWLSGSIPRDEMERRLLATERTERGLMRAFMRVYADRLGRPVMGEKTPAHLAHVDTLLGWFPSGRVIHMIRDPRAVYVSDLRRRRSHRRRPFSWLMKVPLLLQLVLLLQVLFVWRGAARRHALFEARYPGRYMLVRFEDLVSSPEETLRRVFDVLGVEIPSNVTDVTVVSRGFNWGAAGLDAAAADRWRDHIHPLAKAVLSLGLGRHMRRLGFRV